MEEGSGRRIVRDCICGLILPITYNEITSYLSCHFLLTNCHMRKVSSQVSFSSPCLFLDGFLVQRCRLHDITSAKGALDLWLTSGPCVLLRLSCSFTEVSCPTVSLGLALCPGCIHSFSVLAQLLVYSLGQGEGKEIGKKLYPNYD